MIQRIELYNRRLISYSLGNFQFDPNISNTKSNRPLILSLELSLRGLESHSIIPIEIGDDLVPKVSIEIQDDLLGFIQRAMLPITAGIVNRKWWFEQIAQEYFSGNFKNFVIRIKQYGPKHFLQCIRWFISPLCLKCYAGIVRQAVRSFLQDYDSGFH